MKALLAGVLMASLSGCAMLRGGTDPAPVQEPEPAMAVAPPDCGEISADVLKPQARVEKAAGVVADSVDVAIARGDQVDVANDRIAHGNAALARVAAALKKHGCLRVRR